MRHFRIAFGVLGLALAGGLSLAGLALAQETGGAGLAQRGPHSDNLAERAFQAGMGESRAQVIGAESGLFAERMALIYLAAPGGASWRAEVAKIHDPARVSGLLHEALGRVLAEEGATPDLLAALGAVGVSAEGQGMLLATRLELARPDGLAVASERLRADAARGAPVLAAIDAMIATQDMVMPALAGALNRQLAFATSFGEAGGFDFPTSPEDAAADLMLQSTEIAHEVEMRLRLEWYVGYGPLGAAAVNRAAARRASPEARALDSLIDRAEALVLEQLAAESGRAAAARMRGVPL
ncbi:MAG: hypothetical protein Q4G26_16350 [Paracoccus sp. (in: a-proteobacteria)]|nr:hypothetical protein [Paracoccus sp. (in: a-proteobacteria)]